jgi:hypothetical protein
MAMKVRNWSTSMSAVTAASLQDRAEYIILGD